MSYQDFRNGKITYQEYLEQEKRAYQIATEQSDLTMSPEEILAITLEIYNWWKAGCSTEPTHYSASESGKHYELYHFDGKQYRYLFSPIDSWEYYLYRSAQRPINI